MMGLTSLMGLLRYQVLQGGLAAITGVLNTSWLDFCISVPFSAFAYFFFFSLSLYLLNIVLPNPYAASASGVSSFCRPSKFPTYASAFASSAAALPFLVPALHPLIAPPPTLTLLSALPPSVTPLPSASASAVSNVLLFCSYLFSLPLHSLSISLLLTSTSGEIYPFGFIGNHFWGRLSSCLEGSSQACKVRSQIFVVQKSSGV